MLTDSHSKRFENKPETKGFLGTALEWQGSVTPRVLPRVLVVSVYSFFIWLIGHHYPEVGWPITPFEYSGAVLALILVSRLNAGHERWWEARKIWGDVVNKSRNLALILVGYASESKPRETALKWIAVWPHVMRESLRGERQLREVERILGNEERAKVFAAEHMPTYLGLRVAQLLRELRADGLDPFAFAAAEAQRAALIDAIGAAERIKTTRMPLVLAIKSRLFILLFVLLLPLALIDRAGWLTPLVVALSSFPLFSLDQIGAELQNPFSPRNLSHLPLDTIGAAIEKNVFEVRDQDRVGSSAMAGLYAEQW